MKFLVVVLLTACVVPFFSSEAAPYNKKIIAALGWDMPSTKVMHDNIVQMETRPFDGMTFFVLYKNAANQTKSLHDSVVDVNQIQESWLQGSLTDVQTTNFQKFKHNFLRVNMTPGNVEWSDSANFPTFLNNFRLAARFAKNAGVRGIFWDLEIYSSIQSHLLFQYYTLPSASIYTYDQMAGIVRQRGRELLQAFSEEFPEGVLFLSFAYSIAIDEKMNLLTNRYGLLRHFLDGALEGAGPGVKIIDGHEGTYGFKLASQFARNYGWFRGAFRNASTVKDLFDLHMEAGFGNGLDYDPSAQHHFDFTNFQNNYFTPSSLATALRGALNTSDQYVWVYNQYPRWWAPNPTMPAAYDRAVLRAVNLARADVFRGVPVLTE